METGRMIRELRIKKGMTQEELADKTEVSARTIQRIENGEVDPRAYTLQMIAKALDVDFSLFAGLDSNERKENQEVINNNWYGLLHLSGSLPLLFPTLILWNQRKNKTREMSTHFRAVISFQLCILGVCLGCLWIYWRVDQLIPFIGVLLVGCLVSIINAVNVLNGRPFINPFVKDGNEIK